MYKIIIKRPGVQYLNQKQILLQELENFDRKDAETLIAVSTPVKNEFALSTILSNILDFQEAASTKGETFKLLKTTRLGSSAATTLSKKRWSVSEVIFTVSHFQTKANKIGNCS